VIVVFRCARVVVGLLTFLPACERDCVLLFFFVCYDNNALLLYSIIIILSYELGPMRSRQLAMKGMMRNTVLTCAHPER
jgi:hypothetical protein